VRIWWASAFATWRALPHRTAASGDTSIARIAGGGRLVRDEFDRPQASQITLVSETTREVGADINHDAPLRAPRPITVASGARPRAAGIRSIGHCSWASIQS